ncbi:phage gp6-like head-tail connector protein [Pseudonocardia broussonetiae]|uniref:Phage gp6-like head-tail connector protein n=1 Tax=Pseudonocardia broussonetiae TaxID=2736640 RepID=A0A6M6JVI9_9PSEU|nr:phage gp6-like head-tail connector protein [Pseudonocardia broussonetiae]QJY51253.1 phage gp6-like head-tail connector protein [Pseudonocardia broussonetiae]
MAWAPDYCTTIELRSFVRIPDADAQDDVQMGLAIAAASRAIDAVTHRQFGVVAAPEARYYTARYDAHRSRWYVEIDDLMTLVGLAVAFDAAGDETYSETVTLHALRPVNAPQKARPYTELVVRPASSVAVNGADAGVKVTALWGWTAVPDAVKQATLLQASRLLQRRDSPYGIAGSPDAGSEMRLLAKVDPDVEVALADYRLRRGRVIFA